MSKQQFLKSDCCSRRFPRAFSASLSGITEQGKTLAQTLSSLNQPVSDTSGFFLQLSPAMQPVTAAVYRSGHAALGPQRLAWSISQRGPAVPPPLFGLRDSAYGAGGALDQMTAKIASLQMPTLVVTTDDQGNQRAVYSVPSHAVGGIVERTGSPIYTPAT